MSPTISSRGRRPRERRRTTITVIATGFRRSSTATAIGTSFSTPAAFSKRPATAGGYEKPKMFDLETQEESVAEPETKASALPASPTEDEDEWEADLNKALSPDVAEDLDVPAFLRNIQ